MEKVIVVVPSKERHFHILTESGSKEFKKPAQALEWLQSQGNGAKPTILAIMGGPGQDFFVRLVDLGMNVFRAPMYRLQKAELVEAGAEAKDRAAALLLFWEENPNDFYPMAPVDQTLILVREFSRQRLNIQEFRKAATLQLHGALRTLTFILPEEATVLVELIDKGLKDQFKRPELRRQIEAEFKKLETTIKLTNFQQARLFAIRNFFSNPGFVLGAKKDEQELEKQIARLLDSVPIWNQIKSKEAGLPTIAGLGPAIGGSIISEIGNINRFPSPESLRAYARFHVNKEGKFPHRKAGEIASWSKYLNRAVWLWATDQMPRYDTVWRNLYYWKKAQELKTHPEPVPRKVPKKDGSIATVYDYTLKHLDSRAKRWTGSQFLNYLWDLWQEVEAEPGRDPRTWYALSSWPAYFAKTEAELNAGLLVYLKAEIPKRRKVEPQEEDVVDEE